RQPTESRRRHVPVVHSNGTRGKRRWLHWCPGGPYVRSRTRNLAGVPHVIMPQKPKPLRTIVWFRAKDLRLTDHLPLQDAISTGEVIPLFVVEPSCFAPGNASNAPHRTQYLLDSLVHL